MNIRKATRSEIAYIIATAVLTVAAVVMRAVSLFLYFDTDIAYHTRGAWFPTVSHLFVAASVIFFIVFSAVMFRKIPIEYTQKAPLAARIGAGLCALATFFVAVSDLSSKTAVVGVIFSLGATLYFLSVASGRCEGLVGVVSGLCVIARAILSLSSAYFNVSIQMNAPDKIFFMTASLTVLLFISAELRAVVGRARPIGYRLFAAAAALMCAVASLPSLLAYYAGHIAELTVSIELYFMLLAFSVYSIIRLVCITLCEATEETEANEEPEEGEDGKEGAEATEPSEDTDCQEDNVNDEETV